MDIHCLLPPPPPDSGPLLSLARRWESGIIREASYEGYNRAKPAKLLPNGEVLFVFPNYDGGKPTTLDHGALWYRGEILDVFKFDSPLKICRNDQPVVRLRLNVVPIVPTIPAP